MTHFARLLHLFLLTTAILLARDLLAASQDTAPPANQPASGPSLFDNLNEMGNVGGLDGFLGGGGSELKLSGKVTVQKGSRDGVLAIHAKLTPPWHVYAMDQKGGPGATKLTVKSTEKVELLGPFRPDQEPKERKVEYFEVPLREHYGEVVWSAPVRLAEGVDAETMKLEVQFDGQICSDEAGCRPISGEIVPVAFGGYVEEGERRAESGEPKPESGEPKAESGAKAAGSMPAAGVTEYRAQRSHAAIRGQVEPSTVTPGGKVTLHLTAMPESDWHVYAYAPQDPQEIAKPTLIVVTAPASWRIDNPKPSTEPTVKQLAPDQPPVRYHEGTVTWTIGVQVPPDVPPGEYALSGLIGYQTCTDRGCDPPTGAKFTAQISVGTSVTDAKENLRFEPATYAPIAKLAQTTQAPRPDAPPLNPAEAKQVAGSSGAGGEAVSEPPPTLGMALLYALLGGLILNVMPCVLPVIGLKVLSFVQQAGESRSKILALNVWYSLGLLSVFLVLATVAVIWNLVWGKQFGWGEQFTSDVFTITMTAVVFAMGLSFLGVWEIPIPGFAGGEAANKLAEKEGPAGAFAKGVITTILATPCTGPGVAIAWAYCQGKPAGFVYLILATMGLGMASPYLLIGAFPKLMRILPKPGMWMETFKQFMGLVLMGTAVYLLTFTHWVNVLPALTLLLGLAVACWWLGRISITAEFSTRLRGWLIAALIVIVSGVFAFFPGKVTVAGYSLHGLRSIMGYRFERDVARAAASQGDSDPILDSPEIARQITKHDTEIRWVPYTEKRLNRLIAQDRTVLVDFTADWCPTCKWLEATVLNTQDVRDVLRQNGVVTLVADWTKHDPEVTRKLDSLGSAQVPVVAIFPAGRPNDRVILRGFYSKATLLDKLKQAGQSPVVEEVNYGAGCL